MGNIFSGHSNGNNQNKQNSHTLTQQQYEQYKYFMEQQKVQKQKIQKQKEQLDLLYHDIDSGKFGADAKTGNFYLSRKAVKDKYPKG